MNAGVTFVTSTLRSCELARSCASNEQEREVFHLSLVGKVGNRLYSSGISSKHSHGVKMCKATQPHPVRQCRFVKIGTSCGCSCHATHASMSLANLIAFNTCQLCQNDILHLAVLLCLLSYAFSVHHMRVQGPCVSLWVATA